MPEAHQKLFSEKLQALLDYLKETNATAKDRIEALIDHIKAIKHGSMTPAELDNKRSKALWNNRHVWHAPEDEHEAIDLIKEIDSYIFKNASRDWKSPCSNASYDLCEDLQALCPNLSEQDIYEIYRLAAQNS